MPCLVSQGRDLVCGAVIGGVKEVYFMTQENLLESTTWTDTAGVLDFSGTATVYKYVLRPEQTSFAVNVNAEWDTGAHFFEQVLSAVFHNPQAADFPEVKNLLAARPTIFVLDNNDNVFVMGAEYGCVITGGSLETGTAYTDQNRLALDFTAKERNFLYTLPATSGAGTTNYPFDGVTGTITVST